jgi:uncharacterized protein YodC (DUF2158 family)
MLTATIDTLTPPPARFSIGDVVTLKDGGPRMTVTYAGPVALNPGELRREVFAPSSVRAEPRSIPAGSVQWNRIGRAA